VKVSKVEVAKAGELGYLFGTYQLSIKDPKGGPAINDTARFSRYGRSKLTANGSVL